MTTCRTKHRRHFSPLKPNRARLRAEKDVSSHAMLFAGKDPDRLRVLSSLASEVLSAELELVATAEHPPRSASSISDLAWRLSCGGALGPSWLRLLRLVRSVSPETEVSVENPLSWLLPRDKLIVRALEL